MRTLLPALVLALAAGCFPIGREDGPDRVDLPGALDDWFEARRVQWTGTLTMSVGGVPQGAPQAMEGWYADDMLRLDIDLTGSQPRTLIVRDGTATFFRYHSGQIQPAVAPAEQYLLEHRRPPAGVRSVGVDTEWSCVRYEAEIDTVYREEGAANDWYAETVAWCLDDDTLAYMEHIGGLPERADTRDPNQKISLFRSVDVLDLDASFSLDVFDDPF